MTLDDPRQSQPQGTSNSTPLSHHKQPSLLATPSTQVLSVSRYSFHSFITIARILGFFGIVLVMHNCSKNTYTACLLYKRSLFFVLSCFKRKYEYCTVCYHFIIDQVYIFQCSNCATISLLSLSLEIKFATEK